MRLQLKNGKIVEAVKNDELCAAKYINKEPDEYIYDDEIEKILDDKYILTEKGKQLSWLLRHDSDSFKKGLIDEHGYRNVEEIKKNYNYTQELLDEIVETNNKKRYEYNNDKTKIRARQGHSIDVDVELKEDTNITEKNPYLYHGTSDKFIEDIKKEGLIPKTRQYVHLSVDIQTAINVGKRHGGKTYIITIDAYKMKCDGIKIYISNNGVYCVKKVEPKYFKYLINKK